MAMSLARTLITKPTPTVRSSIFTRAASSLCFRSSSPLLRLRPLLLLSDLRRLPSPPCSTDSRGFSTRSLNDPSPNWNNRPPKETILLDGCDFEHWLIVLEKPDENMTRDDIIDSYIKTAAKVIGSEEEARMKIYSVSTKHYFAFGVIVPEEDSNKFKDLPGVRWVLPDSYLDVRNKDYGGEPFINGQAVPYDPKYHEEWVRNNAKANDRSRRNDRPRNFDRTRNFERRRENTQAGNYGNPGPNAPNAGGGGPPPNFQNQSPNMRSGPPNVSMQNNAPGYAMPPNPNMQSTPPNSGGFSNNPSMQNNSSNYGAPPPNSGGFSNNPSMQNSASNYGPPPPNGGGFSNNPSMQNNASNYGAPPYQQNRSSYADIPPRGPAPNAGHPNVNPMQNTGGFPPRDGVSNMGYSNNAGPNNGYSNMQNRDAQYSPSSGGMPYQNQGSAPIPNSDYQNSYVPPPPPPQPSGNAYQNHGSAPNSNRDYQNSYVPPPPPPPPQPSGNAYQVRDIPGRDDE